MEKLRKPVFWIINVVKEAMFLQEFPWNKIW